jgi:hypothetical protein
MTGPGRTGPVVPHLRSPAEAPSPAGALVKLDLPATGTSTRNLKLLKEYAGEPQEEGLEGRLGSLSRNSMWHPAASGAAIEAEDPAVEAP